MDIDANTRNWIITGIIVVVIAVLGWWLIASRKNVSPVTGGDSMATTTQDSSSGSTKAGTSGSGTAAGNVNTVPVPVATASGEMVSVLDQPAGSFAMIASVQVTKPSWVAIKDTKGWILGAARVEASAEAVQVPLLRNTVAGETYQALIYVDDGDKQFDFHKDLLVTSSEGAPVAATFSALNGD